MENQTVLQQKLAVLAGQLNLTNYDEPEEPYILNQLEEQQAISHAIQTAKNNFRFKRLALSEPLGTIELKISQTNWEEEINIPNLLKSCNSNKHYEIWVINKREEDRMEELKKLQQLKDTYTAKFVYSLMAWTSKNIYGKQLIVNDSNKRLITSLCFFISSDPRFESELGYSFEKGLLIRGISGLGKTYLVKCLKDNEIQPILILSMIEIAEAVKAEGEFDIRLSDKINYLDDVGTEEHTINHFGTKINFFKSFIETYYLNNRPFNKLIISTNNNFNEIESKYGFRVRSRLKDMFNVIDVTGNDMRG